MWTIFLIGLIGGTIIHLHPKNIFITQLIVAGLVFLNIPGAGAGALVAAYIYLSLGVVAGASITSAIKLATKSKE